MSGIYIPGKVDGTGRGGRVMNYWYGDNPNCGRCGHLNGHGFCNMTACIYPVIETTTIVTPEIKPQTNYDRIVSKSPEELAKFMGELPCCPPGAEVNELCYPMDSCEGTDLRDQCWLDWLKQEATE